jgi:hypothetical protein
MNRIYLTYFVLDKLYCAINSGESLKHNFVHNQSRFICLVRYDYTVFCRMQKYVESLLLLNADIVLCTFSRNHPVVIASAAEAVRE